MERLELALNINPGLDGLYAHTLSRAERFPRFPDILATLALFDWPLSIEKLSHFISMDKHKIVDILVHLQAIIQVPGDDITPVTFFHTSMRDFLLNATRAGRFFVESSSLDQLYMGLLTRAEQLQSFADGMICVQVWDGKVSAEAMGYGRDNEFLEALDPLFDRTQSPPTLSPSARRFLSDLSRSRHFNLTYEEAFRDALARTQNHPLLPDILTLLSAQSGTDNSRCFLEWFSMITWEDIDSVIHVLKSLRPLVELDEKYFRPTVSLCPSLCDYLADPSNPFHIPQPSSLEDLFARYIGQLKAEFLNPKMPCSPSEFSHDAGPPTLPPSILDRLIAQYLGSAPRLHDLEPILQDLATELKGYDRLWIPMEWDSKQAKDLSDAQARINMQCLALLVPLGSDVPLSDSIPMELLLISKGLLEILRDEERTASLCSAIRNRCIVEPGM